MRRRRITGAANQLDAALRGACMRRGIVHRSATAFTSHGLDKHRCLIRGRFQLTYMRGEHRTHLSTYGGCECACE